MSARILVAEDSPTQAEALKVILECEGWAVEVSPDGRHALERLRAEPFDLVLADATMPHMDGFALCRAMRADPRTGSLPFALLTGAGDADALLRALRAGVDEWFGKPLDVDVLLEGVRALVDRCAERRATARLALDLVDRVAELEPLRCHDPEGFARLEATVRELAGALRSGR